jgi:transcriptional regulator with XRE-family HTH domain
MMLFWLLFLVGLGMMEPRALTITYVFDGAELRRRRKANGLRIEGLAALADLSHKTLVFYESGRTKPSSEMVGKLAAILGCDPGDLFARRQVA